MQFRDDDNALITNLHQFKEYDSRMILTKFFEKKTGKRKDWKLSEKIRETENTDQRHGSGKPMHARRPNQENDDVTAMDELVLSYIGKTDTNTSFNTPDFLQTRV